MMPPRPSPMRGSAFARGQGQWQKSCRGKGTRVITGQRVVCDQPVGQSSTIKLAGASWSVRWWEIAMSRRAVMTPIDWSFVGDKGLEDT